jgi:hypothetical protein
MSIYPDWYSGDQFGVLSGFNSKENTIILALTLISLVSSRWQEWLLGAQVRGHQCNLCQKGIDLSL